MKGTTLIDVLIGSALVLIVFLGVFGLYELGLKISFQNQHRSVSTAIANEYMERARNFSYDEVGVQGGYPEGFFEALETVVRNGFPYQVAVSVHYIADPADGIGFPEDQCPNDYKQIVVSVGWQGGFPGETIMSTNIAPSSEIQECNTVGGILNTNVFDPFGEKVADATVIIEDIYTSLSDFCVTGPGGSCRLLLPESIGGMGENYHLSVSKGGWSRSRTFGTGEEYNGKLIVNPFLPHATLFSGETTEISFLIGEVSALRINVRSFREPEIPLGFVEIGMKGSKIVGEDFQENPIFKYEAVHIANQDGDILLSELEWDNYTFWSSGLNIKDPEGSVSLIPGTSDDIIFYVDSDHSLLVTVKGSDEMIPVFSASIRIFGNETDKTLFTDNEGRSLFISLEEGIYGIEVLAEGYDSFEGEVSVSGSTTRNINLQLNPN